MSGTKCEWIRELIPDYAAGRLADGEKESADSISYVSYSLVVQRIRKVWQTRSIQLCTGAGLPVVGSGGDSRQPL